MKARAASVSVWVVLAAGACALGAEPSPLGEVPGALPPIGETIACPDPESLAVLYSSAIVPRPSAVVSSTVLYGRTRFALALAQGDCDERFRVESIGLFLNEAPVFPTRMGEARYEADLGHDLAAASVRAEVSLRGSGGHRTLTYQVETLDASVAREAKRSMGGRREERVTVASVPFDSIALPVIARGNDQRPVAGLGRESFRFSVDGKRIDPRLVKSVRPPGEKRALRVALLVDASSHLEDGPQGGSWDGGWPRFVDETLLEGLRSFVGGEQADVEFVVFRYAGTPDWFIEPPFLRAWEIDEGALERLRSFLLSPARPEWRAYESSLTTALKAVEPLLHYAPGATAIVVVGAGRDTAAERSFRYVPALVSSVRRAREEEVRILGRELERGDPAGKHDLSERIRQHNLRRPPLVYAYVVPDAAVWKRSLDEFIEDVHAYGGLAYQGGDPGARDALDQVVFASVGVVRLSEVLARVAQDVLDAHLVTLDVPNRQQGGSTRTVSLRLAPAAGPRPAELRHPTRYAPSRPFCEYAPEYLESVDPMERFAAARAAGDCWQRAAVVAALEDRIAWTVAPGETNADVRRQLERSYVQALFRRLVGSPSQRDRRAALDRILRSSVDALGSDHRALATTLAGETRPSPSASPRVSYP